MTEPVIGSVAVEVVPNASGFWRKFQTETGPQAASAGNQAGKDFGNGFSKQGSKAGDKFASELRSKLDAAIRDLPDLKINADSTDADRKLADLRTNLETLRDAKVGVDLSDRDALEKMVELRAELAALSKDSESISVKVNTSSAVSELNKFEKAITDVTSAAETTGSSGAADAGAAGGSPLLLGGLAAGIALVGPAAGASAAALGGLAGALGTAYLAYKGIEGQIKANTDIGRQFEGQIKTLGTTLSGLEKSAALGADSGVLSSFKQINGFLPTLNPEVKTLGSELGKALSITTGGLISGLKAANPLIQDAGKYAEMLAQQFANFAASPQFAQFVGYAQQELPQIINLAENTGKALVDIGVAFHPIGDGLINEFTRIGEAVDGFSKLVSSAGSANTGGLSSLNPGSKSILSKITGGLKTMFAGNKELNDLIANANSPAVPPTVPQATLSDGTKVTQAQALSLRALAAQYGSTDVAVKKVTDAMTIAAQKTADQTLQLQLQSDASGLLAKAMGGLNTNAFGVAQAQTAVNAATLQVVGSLKQNGKSLDQTKAAGVANVQTMQSAYAASLQLADQTAKQTGSTDKARASILNARNALLAQLASQHLLTPAIQQYIDKLFAIPKTLKTKIDVQNEAALAAIAAIKAKLADVTAVTHYIDVQINTKGAVPNVAIARDLASGNAAGGFISGPGTGTSDSIPAMLSNGEFVVNAAQTAQYRGLLENINKGVAGFASGGYANSVRGALAAPIASGHRAGPIEFQGVIAVDVKLDGRTVDRQLKTVHAREARR